MTDAAFILEMASAPWRDYLAPRLGNLERQADQDVMRVELETENTTLKVSVFDTLGELLAFRRFENKEGAQLSVWLFLKSLWRERDALSFELDAELPKETENSQAPIVLNSTEPDAPLAEPKNPFRPALFISVVSQNELGASWSLGMALGARLGQETGLVVGLGATYRAGPLFDNFAFHSVGLEGDAAYRFGGIAHVAVGLSADLAAQYVLSAASQKSTWRPKVLVGPKIRLSIPVGPTEIETTLALRYRATRHAYLSETEYREDNYWAVSMGLGFAWNLVEKVDVHVGD